MLASAGGIDRHALQLLEGAARRYISKHERYPVVVLDHADTEACNLGDPASPLLQLGRLQDAESPNIRTIAVMDDYNVESLRQRKVSNSSSQGSFSRE